MYLVHSIDAPENVTLIPIKGEVVEIVRNDWTNFLCQVIDEGSKVATVNLSIFMKVLLNLKLRKIKP